MCSSTVRQDMWLRGVFCLWWITSVAFWRLDCFCTFFYLDWASLRVPLNTCWYGNEEIFLPPVLVSTCVHKHARVSSYVHTCMCVHTVRVCMCCAPQCTTSVIFISCFLSLIGLPFLPGEDSGCCDLDPHSDKRCIFVCLCMWWYFTSELTCYLWRKLQQMTLHETL